MAENYAMSQLVISVRRFKPFEGQNRLRMQELLTGKNQKQVCKLMFQEN